VDRRRREDWNSGVTDLPAGGGAMRHRALLLLLVVTWAVSWPAIKVGVSVVPPLWYACLRYLIAATCLFALLMLRRQLVFPPRSDWPLIAVSGALQMGTYSALTSFALTVLPPGRAAVLAFSTPIWVVPLAAWRLRERVSRVGLLGVGVGMLGVLAIAAPSLHASGTQIASYAMLIGAAAAWAVTIVFVRSHRFTASAFALAPWQMLLATILLTLVAIVVEGPPAPMPARGLASLVYVGPVATAFAYWAVVETGRHFRASTMSMALLATPSVGILISAMTLGETLDPSLIAGAVLIGSGIRMATLAP
jgi:drug/metabolite transporter (DMT)-like permease